MTAVVSNDPSNAGVDWALLCQNQTNCGTLSPLHTASGAPAMYTPPQTLSGNTQGVTIEAFAAADHSKNLVTAVTVTGFASSLKGIYVFETKGQDANNSGGPFQLAGVIVLDGDGNVTSGEQTVNGPPLAVSTSNPNGAVVSVSDAIIGGSYTIGPDGRGTLTINTADQNIGQLGVENLSLVVLSSSHALIATLDNSSLNEPSSETSSGTLDLQTSTTSPTGGYAFAVNGFDINSLPMGLGGILRIDSPNAISGTGSVADLDDPLAGILSLNATVSGTVTKPDSFGSLKFNLTTGFAPSLQFTGYIVDTTHIKLIESDNNGPGTGFGFTIGVAVGQGAATGTFTSNSSFSGNYVFDILGQDPNGVLTSLTSVGQFSADASGNLNSGYNDEILEDPVPTGIEISDSFTGTYTLDSSGMGRVDSTITFSKNGSGPELVFYLTGNGNPPLVLDADDNSASLGFGSVGVGEAFPQAAPPFSFNGKYGLELTQSSNLLENDATGQVTVSRTPGTLTGFVDTTSGFLGFSPLPDSSLSGAFVAIPSSGRFTGTLNNSFFFLPAGNSIAVAFYAVDSNHLLFIETDTASSGLSSLGYFIMRTPVCSSCQ